IKALEQKVARIEHHEGYVYATAPRGLTGAEIDFPVVSVGATEHALLAAVLARGETVIRNAAREPEIGDLAECLNAMGAQVTGHGTGELHIQGVDRLTGADWAVIPDRIEMGTYAVAAAMAGGEGRLTNARPGLIDASTAKLREAGCEGADTAHGGIVRRNAGRRR